MDIISKINLLLKDEVSGATTTGDVEQNTAKGKVDVVGGKCPEGYAYDKKNKVCVPIKNESANNPKKGDRFIYKGKKLTVTKVGSGLGMDKYIDVKFDDEKHGRSISMKNFFKGDEFKYIKESTIDKKLFFELGSKINQELINMHVMTLKPKLSDFSKVAKKFGVSSKEASRAWNYFTWGDESLLPETSVVGGSYISGTTSNIIGSQQTRTGFMTKRKIIDLARKEKVEVEMEDPTDTNIIGRRNLKFSKKSGAFIPDFWLEGK